jgi:Tfp pilus assembly protein PilF
MSETARTQFELEQRVLRAMKDPWVTSRDGTHRNMGTLARKAGVTTNDFVRTLSKLEREWRL